MKQYITNFKKNFKKTRLYFWGYKQKELSWKHLIDKNVAEASAIRYKQKLHTNLNLEHPSTLNEKIQYLKLNDFYNNDLVTQLADKYEVRSYIKNAGLGFLLNDLYGLYDNINDLNWNSLPEQCAIKCTFGAGRNIIIDNKQHFSEKKVKSLLKSYLSTPFGYSTVQPHYLSMKKDLLWKNILVMNKATIQLITNFSV